MTSRPLDGIVVVALEQAVAAPLATRHLADLGARVIKIERTGGGDFARGYDETVRGLSSAFVWLNRSKESVTLDVKHPEAGEILRRLVAHADVFVQNLAPGAADRLGMDAGTLRAGDERLVVCNISGYGPDGPYRDKKAYDLLVQGESGIISMTGTHEVPAKVGISVADVAAGMYAYSAVLGALFRRERTGVGAVIDVSLFEALAEWMSHNLYYVDYGGHQPQRMGTSHPMIAPYGAFRTGDGQEILLAVQSEREWQAFCATVLGDARVASDPRFATMSDRVANRQALEDLVGARLGALDTGDATALLDRAQIAWGRVNSVHDLARHPQLAARVRWREIDSPAGRLWALLPPAVPDDVPPRLDPVPALGEHTDEVLRWLGYAADEVRHLRSGGVV